MKAGEEAPAAKPAKPAARVLRELARLRLAARGAQPENEPDYIKQLRVEGNCILGGPGGYVILPAESD